MVHVSISVSHFWPPGDAVAVYVVIAELCGEKDSPQLTATDLSRATEVTVLGAHGAIAGASTANNLLGVCWERAASWYVIASHVALNLIHSHAALGSEGDRVLSCKNLATAPAT
jgi:hypothetical protein